MTLQEFYDKAIEMGATPDSLIVVEYCSMQDTWYSKEDNIIYID